MKMWYWILMAAVCAQFANGQTAPKQCSDFDQTVALSTLAPANTTEHALGFHSWGVTPIASCIYTHGPTQTCNTECLVASTGSTSLDPLGGFISIEKGTLTALGTHQISGAWSPADSISIGAGLSCTGHVAAAAANCFTVPGNSSACFVSVSLSAGGVSVNTNGTQIWSSGPVDAQTTCAAQADPQNAPTPTPTPAPPVSKPGQPCDNDPTAPGGGGDQPDFISGCSPIVIDLTGNGFELTDAAHGVLFDIANTGVPVQIAWTANANNAFLVLDRDGNGSITSGAELFGNFTSQPSSSRPNGFLALAVYDDPANGGNGDGIIDARDQIFSKLRLWVDANHDGICQPGELHTLPEMGVFSIGLNYSLSMRTDEFGNVFRYRGTINQGQSGEPNIGKKIYDIFFVSQ